MNKKKVVISIVIITLILVAILLYIFIKKDNVLDTNEMMYFSLKVEDISDYSIGDVVDIYIENSEKYGLFVSNVEISNISKLSSGNTIVIKAKNDIVENLNKIKHLDNVDISLVKSNNEYRVDGKTEMDDKEIQGIINSKISDVN